MSHLLTKSQENIESASLLINHNKFAASVHCSYYSCLQNIKHILFVKLNFTLEEIEIETKGESSHIYLLNKIAGQLYLKDNIKSAEFRQEFERIKVLRKKADYQNKLILQKEAKDCFGIVNNTNTILNSIF